METLSFLANVRGWYFIIFGLLFLFARKGTQTIMKVFSQDTGLVLGGWLALVVGLLMIHTYQDRSTLLSGFVSLLGRISLLKGISILAFPQLKTSVTKLYTKSFLIVAGIVSILIGVALLSSGISLFA